MSEYKFLAMIYSFRQLAIVLVPLILIMVYVLFFTDLFYTYFLTIFVSILVYNILSFVITNRYIKIIIADETICIFYWGKLKYRGHINQLKYIIGKDINDNKAQGELQLVFNDTTFYFLIWESYGLFSSSLNKQVKILRELVGRYQLVTELNSNSLLQGKTYKYINTENDPTMGYHDSYNKKEK